MALKNTKEIQSLPNDLPPSYEESLKHEKIEDIAHVTRNAAGPFQQAPQASQSPRFLQQANMYPTHPPPNYQASYQQQTFPQTNAYPQQQVFVANAFDGGARFNPVSPPSIPPPPPGVAPNAAQMAARAGAQIIASKKKNSFW